MWETKIFTGTFARLFFGVFVFGAVSVNAWSADARKTSVEPILQSPTEKKIAAQENTHNASVGGIVIGTYQISNQSRVNGADVDGEGNAQLFLHGDLDVGPGTFHMEVRGGTTPRSTGVTATFGEANASIGETLDQNGDGRFSVTQLFYELDFGRPFVAVGLLDSTAILDGNDVADDEYSQFLGSSFVDDPTIEFPSFALAGAFGLHLSDAFTLLTYISSTNGLDEAADPTYSNVFHPGRRDKGVFVAQELNWGMAGLNGNLGLWTNTDDHPALNGTTSNKDNYGAYLSVQGSLGAAQWNAWLSGARESVSAARNFIGGAISYPLKPDVTVGAALSRTGVSHDLPGPRSSTVQAELYARIRVVKSIYVSPDIQYLDNSGFDPSTGDTVLVGLRVGAEF